MKQIAVILSVLLFALAGCTPEADDNSLSSFVVILNNQTENVSRSYEEKATMEEGDIVSFFSQGGVEADNIPLTCQGNRWEPETDLQWNTSGEAASVRAYYPAFTTESQTYYDTDGHLKDVLHAWKQTAYCQPINLQFTHLFAKVIFEANETLHAKMERISFTPSVRLESINPSDGTLNLTESPAPTVSFEKQDNRTYTFLVPPADNLSIEIRIQTTEGEQTLTTSAQTFASGQQYTYQLISKKEEVGIFTAEDFIAFSYLINNMTYEGRTLDEFGREENGKMTYYLCADISFTEEQSARVQPIGFKKQSGNRDSTPFYACFDGQGHTLSNLHLTTIENTNYQGLFGNIDPTGIVKNLILEHCSYTKLNSQNYFEGMLAGYNGGIIDGCQVKSCTITNQEAGRVGGLVGENRGSIVNCLAYDIKFEGKTYYAGGLCSHTYSKIINSYTLSCNFKNVAQGGGISYSCSTGAQEYNCYVYDLIPNTNFGELGYEVLRSSTIIKYCYYPETCTSDPVYKNFTLIQDQSTIYTYDAGFTVTQTGESLVDALNEWVDKNQDKYTSFTLRHWENSSEGIPVLCQEP